MSEAGAGGDAVGGDEANAGGEVGAGGEAGAGDINSWVWSHEKKAKSKSLNHCSIWTRNPQTFDMVQFHKRKHVWRIKKDIRIV